MKPLGHKSYGSIPHLKGSRLGPADHHCSPGQEVIATIKSRDKWDKVYVQEKLDGGNVGVAKINGNIIALTRAGYLATSSKYKTHHVFKIFVDQNFDRFNKVLKEGERLCGEWLFTAVGTKYNLPHEPLVVFDLMRGAERLNMEQLRDRLDGQFVTPRLFGFGPMTMEQAINEISTSGHGALEEVEGAIWRVERKNKVDFLCKYVRPSKVDGKYLDTDIINGMPKEFDYLVKGFAQIVMPGEITETPQKTIV
jgi:ATP-dependent RNA circularization protein (DNA/RNA ligase family)